MYKTPTSLPETKFFAQKLTNITSNNSRTTHADIRLNAVEESQEDTRVPVDEPICNEIIIDQQTTETPLEEETRVPVDEPNCNEIILSQQTKESPLNEETIVPVVANKEPQVLVKRPDERPVIHSQQSIKEDPRYNGLPPGDRRAVGFKV